MRANCPSPAFACCLVAPIVWFALPAITNIIFISDISDLIKKRTYFWESAVLEGEGRQLSVRSEQGLGYCHVCRNTFSSPCSGLSDFLFFRPHARCSAYKRHPHDSSTLACALLAITHFQIIVHDITRVCVCTGAGNSSCSYTVWRKSTRKNPVVPCRTHCARPLAGQGHVPVGKEYCCKIDQALFVRSLVSFPF